MTYDEPIEVDLKKCDMCKEDKIHGHHGKDINTNKDIWICVDCAEGRK